MATAPNGLPAELKAERDPLVVLLGDAPARWRQVLPGRIMPAS
jgi:hypothetical protein